MRFPLTDVDSKPRGGHSGRVFGPRTPRATKSAERRGRADDLPRLVGNWVIFPEPSALAPVHLGVVWA